MAYSLSIPFVSTFTFAAVMKHQDAPGTTFKRHLKIAQGVLSEDDCSFGKSFSTRVPKVMWSASAKS